jgi:hypothetical protein
MKAYSRKSITVKRVRDVILTLLNIVIRANELWGVYVIDLD